MTAIATTAPDSSHLRSVRAALLAERHLRGRRFCDVYTSAVDAWLSDLFAGAVAQAGLGGVTGLALVAVGGCGRRELTPGSDLDLVLVHDGVRGIAAVADALWYPIWDAGVHLDHSVRTRRDVAAVVGADIKAALSLLSARFVAGDAALADAAIAEARRRWTDKPRLSLDRLRDAIDERWARHGELAFLLEPDVKLARGGLRDLDSLSAAGLAAPVAQPLLDDPRLEAARDDLLAVRVALHATTGRRADVLLLSDQDAVARRLGYADAEELLPELALAARRVSWITDEVWWRIKSWLAGPRRTGHERVVGPGLVARDGELVLDPAADPGRDSALALRLAAASARTGVPIAPPTLARLQGEATSPPEPWPAPTRHALLDLLGCGHAAVPLLEALDHLGVLARYVREWQAVRSRPQRNAYHQFTVDRHLFETAAEAAALTRAVHRPDLLLVAAWLHDVGKGFPGDHTEAGVRLVGDIAARMGFERDDVAVLQRLVDNHLLLAETATRRDLDDPATIRAVAARVRSADELELLAALTRADSIATGPAAWSSWKAQLIDELVLRVHEVFGGEERPAAPAGPTVEHRRLMAERRLRVLRDGDQVTVIAPDRPGLLAVVAGLFAVHRLPVRAASGTSDDGMAVEVFDLDVGAHDEPDWVQLEGELEGELEAALADPSTLAARLAQRAQADAAVRRAGAAKVVPPRVVIDTEATPRATIVEVRAPDGPGVLAAVAGALARCGCDIRVVRALTLGHEVVDTFYVVDSDGGAKLADTARLAAIEQAVLDALDAPAT